MFDAIVVGSGISGGWVAKELCERGLKVLMLERGPDVPHGPGYSHDAAAKLRLLAIVTTLSSRACAR